MTNKSFVFGDITVSQELKFARADTFGAMFVFSFSGAFVIDGSLPPISSGLDGEIFEIYPPIRLAQPSFRPNPQFDAESFRRVFDGHGKREFPLQAAAFPAVNGADGAYLNCWFGPDCKTENEPVPSPDTLLVKLSGRNAADRATDVQRYIVEPFLTWLRIMTDQWWIGRSFEGICGPLHFVAPFGANGRTVGDPLAIATTHMAGSRMVPITPEIWVRSASSFIDKGRAPASLALASDSKFFLASGERRAGVILACCAFEAARDEALAKNGYKISDLGHGKAELLKHVSSGFYKIMKRNMQCENPDLFQKLKSFWLARGDAAHGKEIFWRTGDQKVKIEMIAIGELTAYIDDVIDWFEVATER